MTDRSGEEFLKALGGGGEYAGPISNLGSVGKKTLL